MGFPERLERRRRRRKDKTIGTEPWQSQSGNAKKRTGRGGGWINLQRLRSLVVCSGGACCHPEGRDSIGGDLVRPLATLFSSDRLDQRAGDLIGLKRTSRY